MSVPVSVRDALANEYALRYAKLALMLAEDSITIAQWRQSFSELLTEMIANGYVLARGGIGRMADADWLAVARIVRDQHAYFEAFASSMQLRIDGRPIGQSIGDLLAELQPYIAQRSALYAGSAVNAFEQGKAAAASEGRGVLVLPVYPADGATQCKSSCRCSWEISSDDDAREWVAVWRTEGDDRVCDSCRERGMLYRHVVVPYDSIMATSAERR